MEVTINKSRKEEIDEKVLEGLKEGKTKKSIMATLHISDETLSASIYRLISRGSINGKDIEKFKREARERKQKESLLKYLNEGMSKEEAGRKIHMGNADVYKFVEELVKEGKIDETYLYYGNGIRERNKLKVLKKLEEGYTINEASEILGMNRSTVYEYTRELVEEGKIKRADIKKKIKGKVVKKGRYANQIDGENETEPKRITESEGNLVEENEDTAILSNAEMQAIVVDLIKSGWQKKDIAKELKIDFKKLRKIIDGALIEGKLKFPIKSKNNSKTSNESEREEKKEKCDIEKWKIAMNNIEKRLQARPIKRVDQRLYFMYCRRLIENGIELSDNEIATLNDIVVYGEESVGIDKIKFVGIQYLKKGNINLAVDMINDWIKLHGRNEEYETAKNIFSEIDKKQREIKKSVAEETTDEQIEL